MHRKRFFRGTSENIAFRVKSSTKRGVQGKSVCLPVRLPIDKGLSKHLIEAAQKKHANWKGSLGSLGSLGSWVRIVEGVDPF
jgi:hypothetical protein